MNESKLPDIVKYRMKRVLFQGNYSTIYGDNLLRNNVNKRSVTELSRSVTVHMGTS